MSKTTHQLSLSSARLFLFSVPLLIIMTLSIGIVYAKNKVPPYTETNSNIITSGSTHKVIAPPGVLDTSLTGVTLWHDYGSFALYLVTDEALEQLPPQVKSQIHISDQMDRILIDALDTNIEPSNWGTSQDLVASDVSGAALSLIQFVGPIKDEWLQEVKEIGAIPIQYIATNAYLVWADADSRAQLDRLVTEGEFLQFSAPYPQDLKVGPALAQRDDPDEIVPVVIQMYRHDDNITSETTIQNLEVTQSSDWAPILEFQNTTTTVRVGDIPKITSLPDVFWIEVRMARQRMDEVQGQIMAGNLNVSQSGPTSPGYLTWLDSYGFSTDPSEYPIVDITDDGIGNGTVNSGDPTLHRFGIIANPTRLAYVANCTAASDGGGLDGHGHINVSIAGGYDTRSGFPFQDPLGYQRGLGINPYGQIAGTRIFGPGFDVSNCGGDDKGLIVNIQNNGALISSNSWGCSGCAGSYDDSSQAFDAGTRDADTTEPGNQEMIFIFSAGNSGPSGNSIGTPGNGKNMITIGASENFRSSDEDGNWTDSCGIGPSGANNAMDVISFSSRGPAPGGRIKPELIAPGTHIQGTASTNTSYNGSSVCDQYRPSGQTIFAASSGTSHSTPAVAGAASLAYWWLENTYSLSPSPALMKAYLIAHPTYLTGASANDTLPSSNQGYGMPNMAAMFDDADKLLLDQSVLFDNSGETWTWSGGVADPTKPVRIVLAYTDTPGAIGTSPQVNDLNLAADVGGSTYLGNVFSGQWSTSGGALDTANNYEAIFLPAGTSGDIEVTVTGFNIAGNGIPNSGDSTDQDFALVCYNCTETPDFTLYATPDILEVCSPDDGQYNVEVGQIAGFTDLVTLSASGNPAGSSMNYSINPVTPPGSSTLTIGNTGAVSTGSYDIEITGSSTTDPLSTTVRLDLFEAVPTPVTLLTPGDSATEVVYKPTFEWTSVPLASSYYLEVATDAGLTDIVYTATETITSHTATIPLNALTTYYWRVSAQNVCGAATSTLLSFTTKIPTLTCNSPAVTFENGIPGDWVVVDNTAGTGIVWTTTADPACAITNLTNGSGEAACADSDAAGLGAPAYDSELVLNPLDLTAYPAVALDVKAYYLDIATGANDRFEVDVWDGSSWTNELSWDEDHYAEDFNLDLSTYAGLPTVQVRFRYFGDGWDWYAQVDDITLTCPAPVITVDPAELALIQLPGITTTLPMTITNTGNSDLSWTLMEGDCDLPTDIHWLSVLPDNGVITPAGDTSVDVTFDSTELIPDTYTANLCLSSNDPITPSVTVPVELTVESGDVTIAMTPLPATLLEPGGEVEYTIVVTNTSTEDQTIISLTDSNFDLGIHCPDAVGTLLIPSASYTCTLNESLNGNASVEHLNSATVIVNNNASESDSASVNTMVAILNADPAITVTKVASQPEVQQGNSVEFIVTMTNNSVETDPVINSSIVDDLYGDVTLIHDSILNTDCANGVITQAGDSYTCSFMVTVPYDLIGDQTNTVSMVVTDDEGNQAFDSDNATVNIRLTPLDITLSKTATPNNIFEPGEEVEVAIKVTNNDPRDVTIDSLVDSDFDINTYCPDAEGTVLASSENYTCTFDAFLTGNAIEQHLSSVTVSANDNYSNSINLSATAQLAILNVNPTISVTRGTSRSYVQKGDTIEFTLTMTNNSVDTDPVTITSLFDDIYGDVTLVHDAISAKDCAADLTIQPGDSYPCSFTATIPDLPVEFLTTTMSVTGTDDEGNQVSASEITTLILDYLSIYLPIIHR